jgi:hypothetical protein
MAIPARLEQAAEKCFAVEVLKGHGFSTVPYVFQI